MSLIQVAAPLIRLAAADDGYAQNLHDAVTTDAGAYRGLVTAAIEPAEFGCLKPSEWQWFASWRQALGGRLDEVILLHLDRCAGTRFARFEVRALVLRNPDTNRIAFEFIKPPDVDQEVGLNWLITQVHEPRVDPSELTHDSLQCATEASWFVLRQLTSLKDHRGNVVRNLLDEYARDHEIDLAITRLWYWQRRREASGHLLRADPLREDLPRNLVWVPSVGTVPKWTRGAWQK